MEQIFWHGLSLGETVEEVVTMVMVMAVDLVVDWCVNTVGIVVILGPHAGTFMVILQIPKLGLIVFLEANLVASLEAADLMCTLLLHCHLLSLQLPSGVVQIKNSPKSDAAHQQQVNPYSNRLSSIQSNT